MDWELSPHQTYPVPNLKGKKAILSFHRRWLGITSADGQLELRLMKMLVSLGYLVYFSLYLHDHDKGIGGAAV